MGKYTRKQFDIPWWAVVLALVFAPPLGVVLILLSCINAGQPSVAQRSQNGAAGAQSGNTGTNGAQSENAETSARSCNSASENGAADTCADTTATGAADANGKRSPRRDGRRRSRTASERVSLISSVVLLGFGIISAIRTAVDSDWSLSVSSAVRLILPFALSGGAFLVSNLLRRGRGRRQAYTVLIGDAEAFDLREIASATSLSLRRVRRDIQRMVNSGEFGECAYIDRRTDMLFRSPEAAEAYRLTEQAEPAVGTEGGYDEILREIRRLDDEIADEAVSECIRRIEEYTRHIFAYVTEHPEKKKAIRTFMNYYLPTTLKLLTSYAKIERVGVAGENMKRSKENIESTLELLIEAFKCEVDILFRSESLDISSDIDVLETMLKKDGMSPDGVDGMTRGGTV